MNYYCPNCFSKSEYKFSKPKFCPECGAKTSSDSAVKKNVSAASPKEEENLQNKPQSLQKTIKTNRALKNDEADELESQEEDYEQEYYCSDLHSIISKIKPGKGVSVENYKESKGVSFGSLMQEPSSSSSSNDFKFQNTGLEKTREQILEEFKSEASSTRRHIEIE